MFPQVIVDPTVSPTLNNGGWVYNAAVLLAAIGVIIAVLLVFGYMRFAPRFQTEEGARTSVRAPRVQPGKDVRRPVNVTSAPLVVQPPVVAVAAASSGSAPPAPSAVAPAGGGASHSPSAATPAPATAAAATAPASAPAEAPAAATPAPTPAAAPAATAERPEVSLDEETFEATLAELLAKGTDRRVAEGQARRAAMLAARKKAEG